MGDNLILEWSRDVNLHDSIPAHESVKTRPTSTPYILTIESIEGGSVEISSLIFTVTCFHLRSNTFFGRTFTFGADLSALYHSKIADEEAVAICEIIQLSNDNSGDRKLLGWCKLFCFTERDAENSPIYAGSSRVLLHSQLTSLLAGASLRYSVKLYEELRKVYNILPCDTFYGSHEILPGIQGQHISINRGIYIEKSANLSISNIVVNPGLEIEKKVIAFASRYQNEKLNTPTDTRRPKIQERRVLVGTHNTWTYTGNNGPDSSALLRLEETQLTSPSIISIRDTVDDPMIAIVFDLQYILTIPRKIGESDEVISVNIAWSPHVGEKNGRFGISMMSGPGRSLSGRMLWDISLDIDLEFDISLSGFGPRIVERNIAEMPPDIGNIISENDRKRLAELKRWQEENRRLQEELERERRRPKENLQIIPIPQPQIEISRKMQESSSQTFIPEPERPERLEPVLRATQDYSYLDAVVPTVSNENFAKTTTESLPRHISRADKARLIKSGMRGLLDYDSSPSHYSPRLDIEAQDPLKACTFTIHFLAYRQFPNHKKLPENVCFGMRFYNFANLTTENAHIRPGDIGLPWVIEKPTGAPEMLVRFEIEACEWDVVDFAKYLWKKTLLIEIWDTQSHMILGYCKMPLVELMRQGRPNVVTTKEYAVVDDFNGTQFGTLQVLMRNSGVQSALRVQPSQLPLKITGGQARHKYRARAKPLEVNTADPPVPIGNDENRKRLRVLEFKKSLKKPADELWEHEKELSHISMVRENRKPLVIKQALREYMSNAQKLYVRPGQTICFQFSLHNPNDFEECFTLAISDGDLSIIRSPVEWQWWTTRQNFDKPIEYDCICEDNSIVMRPGENCPVLFKYFSWTPTAKVITAWINQSKGSPLCALEIEVVPECSPVDYVFHFYECESRAVRLRLPPLFANDPQFKPLVQCSQPKTVVNWETDNEVSVEIKVPPAPNTQTFNIVAYDSIYFDEIKANWEIRLHSLVGMDVTVNMGQSTAVRITCPGDEARTVSLFSSNPDVVSFPPPHNKPFTLMPRTVNNLPVLIRSDNPMSQTVRVHCVDVFHKQLIHAWVFRVQTTGTNVTQTFDIKCPLNVITEKKVVFVNRSQSWAMFHFRSSNPSILEIRENRMNLEGGAKGYLAILVNPPPVPSVAEVSVFVNDSEENIFECMLFKIDFSA